MEGISTIVAGLSAIVTGLAGAGYVLGLIALAWPVYSRITGDAYTALFAVSLLPKTVVIGQGLSTSNLTLKLHGSQQTQGA